VVVGKRRIRFSFPHLLNSKLLPTPSHGCCRWPQERSAAFAAMVAVVTVSFWGSSGSGSRKFGFPWFRAAAPLLLQADDLCVGDGSGIALQLKAASALLEPPSSRWASNPWSRSYQLSNWGQPLWLPFWLLCCLLLAGGDSPTWPFTARGLD